MFDDRSNCGWSYQYSIAFYNFSSCNSSGVHNQENGKTSKKKNNSLATTANTQMDDSLLMAETSYDDVVSSGSVESSSLPHLYDNKSMYTNAAYGGYIRLIA